MNVNRAIAKLKKQRRSIDLAISALEKIRLGPATKYGSKKRKGLGVKCKPAPTELAGAAASMMSKLEKEKVRRANIIPFVLPKRSAS